MRTLVLALAALALLTLSAAPASAASTDCISQSVDGAFVKASVAVGTDCRDVSVERCTLQSNPEYPSHPYWHCTRVL